MAQRLGVRDPVPRLPARGQARDLHHQRDRGSQSSATTTTNSYDELERLHEATATGASPSHYRYELDGNSNRTSQTVNPTGGAVTGYVYNSGNELLASGSNSFYSYDGNGNQTTGAHQDFTYNNANQATSIHVKLRNTTETLAFAGAGQCDLIKDGVYTVHSSFGVFGRAA